MEHETLIFFHIFMMYNKYLHTRQEFKKKLTIFGFKIELQKYLVCFFFKYISIKMFSI